MNDGARRGVTRGYAVGLIGAVIILSLALLIAGWGFISLAFDRAPVQTPGISFAAAPAMLGICIALLVLQLWRTVVTLLRGNRVVPLAYMVFAGLGAYLIWSALGLVFGLSAGETWLSPYAVLLGVIWALAPLVLWLVLTRRVYTDRQPPRWPWEKHPAPGDLQYPDYPVDPGPDADSEDPDRR